MTSIYGLAAPAVAAIAALASCTTPVLDTGTTVCSEWSRVVPSYDDEQDTPQTIAEVQKNQDVFVAVCEEGGEI